MVNGNRKDQLFPDNTKKSYKKAVIWENETRKKLEQEQATDMDCLTVLQWAEEYLDYVQERFADKTYKEKRAVFTRFLEPLRRKWKSKVYRFNWP